MNFDRNLPVFSGNVESSTDFSPGCACFHPPDRKLSVSDDLLPAGQAKAGIPIGISMQDHIYGSIRDDSLFLFFGFGYRRLGSWKDRNWH